MTEPNQPLALNLARIVHRLMVDPRGWRVDALKDTLGIAPRTYRKYRALLQEHFDHLLDEGGRQRIEEVEDGDARYLRIVTDDGPPERDHDAFLSRIVALDLVTRIAGFTEGTQLAEALGSLRADFLATVADKPFFLGHVLRNADRMVHHLPDAPKHYDGKREIITTTLRAIFFSHTLRFAYTGDPDKPPRTHRVEPLTVLHWREGLYLIARYNETTRPYLFAIDRMLSAQVGTTRFRYPSTADYEPSRLFEGAFGLFHPRDPTPTDVDLVFTRSPWLHRYLRERTWHPTQQFEELDDGRLRMTFTVSSMVEVWPWIRGFGGDVEVLAPRPQPATHGSG